jgi:hypothetical protein
MKHIDNWLDSPPFQQSENIIYAKWVINYFRLPAGLKIQFNKFMIGFHLFAEWKGNVYRVTGASRMGDVWLSEDFNRENGYDLRVEVSELTNWSNKPDGSYDPNLFPTKPSYDTSQMVTA